MSDTEKNKPNGENVTQIPLAEYTDEEIIRMARKYALQSELLANSLYDLKNIHAGQAFVNKETIKHRVGAVIAVAMIGILRMPDLPLADLSQAQHSILLISAAVIIYFLTSYDSRNWQSLEYEEKETMYLLRDVLNTFFSDITQENKALDVSSSDTNASFNGNA